MGFHTYPIERADALDEVDRFRYCSREELLGWLLEDTGGRVVDIGSGTGFFTLEVAPFVESIIGIDLQQAMLERLVKKDPPQNVHPLTCHSDRLPIADASVDAVFSTMTFHEYATPVAHDEVARVLREDGRLVAVDWTRNGQGESGPSLDERFALSDAVEQVQSAGFHVTHGAERAETFVLEARRV